MNIFDGQNYRKATPEEEERSKREIAYLDAKYWASVDYGEAVNAKIREKYTESQEFSVLRQKDTKTEEYEEYFAYCEACKEFVKIKKAGAV